MKESIKCIVCGKKGPPRWYADTLDGRATNDWIAHKACFDQQFWDQVYWEFEKYPHGVAIVKGKAFSILPDVPPGRMAGFGGGRFRLLFNDGCVVVTKNMWSRGVVPESHKWALPDNAVFVKEDGSSWIE